MKPPRILIVNPLGIGDVIFSTPLVEAIKHHYPDSFIGYVCNKRAHEVIKTNPNIDRIFLYEKDDFVSLWRAAKIRALRVLFGYLVSLRQERFDISIDLSLGYKYSMALWAIGVRRRLGFNYRNRGLFLTDRIDINGFDDKHVVEYDLDFLPFLGIPVNKEAQRPRVYLPSERTAWAGDFFKLNNVVSDDLLVGVVPGCGASWGVDAEYRRWPRQNFAALADRLIEKCGAKVILFGDTSDIPICQEVYSQMKNGVVMACGKTSFGEFLALLPRCALIVTNDGGPLHTAAGLGVKTVSIFGPVDQNVYGPYGDAEKHVVVSRNDLACRPCYRRFRHKVCARRECITEISVDDVFKACERTLGPWNAISSYRSGTSSS